MTATGTVAGVKVIRITSDAPESTVPYLQVGGVVAVQAGTGIDVALGSQGAVATASSVYDADAGPAKAIDGSYPAGIGEMYISATGAPGEYLEITLAAPCSLAGVTIYGRADGCCYRDIYTVALLDTDRAVLFSGRVDGADAAGGATSLAFPVAAAPASLGGRLGWLFGRRKRG